jgi:hypothetical protein
MGEEMEFFSPLHLLILLLSALIVFGVPILLLLLVARWFDRRLQRRPNVRVSVVAVVIGGITDVLATNILAIPLVVYVVMKYGVSHTSVAAAAIVSAIHSNLWLYGSQLAIGISCSALGGYVAAKIAKHDELLNGLLSSFLCVAIGVYSIVLGKGSQSVPVQILLLISSPAFALLGGYFRQTQKRVGHASV